MKESQKAKTRGRPREFCCETALDAAMRVFWEKGYEGASLSELTQAMGIGRPSMYAAFGNKESLYRRTMERYAEIGEQWMADWQSAGTARESVEQLLRSGIERFVDPSYPGGCFAVKGLMTCSGLSGKTRHAMDLIRASLQCGLQARLERAIKAGEIPRQTSAADLARFYAVVFHGMSLFGKSGAAREELLRVAEVAMDKWPSRPRRK